MDEQEISAQIPDWSREKPVQFWDPGRKLLKAIRGYQYWRSRSGIIAALLCKWLLLRYYFWSAVSGAEIPIATKIGGGLLIPHPNGVIIHPDSIIGVNCLILQQVTLANTSAGAPVIEGHVDIGAGAKILGAIRIEAHARIGANAVVVRDVPAGAVAKGVPARNTLKKQTLQQ